MLQGLRQNAPKNLAGWFVVLLAWCGLLVLLHLVLLLLIPSVLLGSGLRLLIAPAAIAILWKLSGLYLGRTRVGWRLVALSCGLWFFGDLTYAYQEVIAGAVVRELPLLAVPYFISTFLMMTTVTYLGYGSRNHTERTALLLETMIIVVGLGLVLWRWFLGVQVATQPFIGMVVEVLSPIVGLSLVGFMLSYLLSQRRGLLTSILLTLGALAIACLIEGVDAINTFGVYQTGHVIDVLGSVAYFCFAAAGVSSILPDTRSTIERNWVRVVNALPYVVFVISFAVFLEFFGSPAHETAPKIVELGILVGIALLAFLTGWRLILANQVNVRLTDELLESQERLELALRGSNDGIWEWKVSEQLVRVSARFSASLGHPEIEATKPVVYWRNLIHPDDLERVVEEVVRHLKGQSEFLALETRLKCANLEYRWYSMRGLAVRHQNRTVRMAGSLTDITGRSGVYDALTGLANRVLFRETIERAIQRHIRHADAFCVMFLDLNDFKIVNDTLGHLVGDELLLQVAKRLEKTVRQGDTLARLGGDEFAVLAERSNKPNKTTLEYISTTMLAERLIRQLEEPFLIGERQIKVSGSIGIVDSSSGFTKADAFLSAADTAMYHAKNTRSKIAFFDQEMTVRLQKRLELENDIRQAILYQQFKLHYQAIFETQSQKVIGFEALLRWQMEDGAFIAPDVFIPIAEQSGLILELGAWVLQLACQTAASWKTNHSISVNVSSQQFENDSFVGFVHQVLVQTRLEPKRLILEITESALLESAETNLIALRALGVQVQIDDFGTGYSSLSYLHRFPVSALKVDKSFVREIDKNQTRAIAKAIILLAQSLGLRVIAEGVETQAQYEVLRELQCDAVQGFLFARPVPEEQLNDFLQS